MQRSLILPSPSEVPASCLDLQKSCLRPRSPEVPDSHLNPQRSLVLAYAFEGPRLMPESTEVSGSSPLPWHPSKVQWSVWKSRQKYWKETIYSRQSRADVRTHRNIWQAQDLNKFKSDKNSSIWKGVTQTPFLTKKLFTIFTINKCWERKTWDFNFYRGVQCNDISVILQHRPNAYEYWVA